MPTSNYLILSLLATTAWSAEVAFEKKMLTPEFVAEGCAVADFNKDGHMDLSAGCYLWHGPDFSKRVNYTPERVNAAGPSKTPYNAEKGYSDFFLSYPYDFDSDGWTDLLVYGLPGEPALLYMNPKGKEGMWAEHAVFDVADGESPGLQDINGDGKPELLVNSSDLRKPLKSGGKGGGQLGYAELDWANPTGKVRFRPITPKSPENDQKYFRYSHSSGSGDVNGDGRIDLLNREGWWEQPADTKQDSNWVLHPVTFYAAESKGGSFMHVYDCNADGKNDIITAYNAHGYGLGWFEQKADGSFTEHKLMGSTPEESPHGVKFTQLHALNLVDMNGDGLKDIVTGKRFWAHGPNKDDEPGAPAVLYWFELKRDDKGTVDFIPHQIDDDSGVGTQLTTVDINGDKKMDVAVANKKGVFVFLQK
jgi:hypothetical protein